MADKLILAEWFGHRLREIREQAGLTQQQLGELSGIQTNSIARIERGEQAANWTTIVNLLNTLKIDANEFTKRPASQEPKPRGRPTTKPKTPPAAPKKRGRPRKET